MPFRFSLDSLLRLRRSQQHAAELHLAATHSEIARHRMQFENLDQQLAHAKASATNPGPDGITGAELHWFCVYAHQLSQQRESMLLPLAALEQRRQEQQAILAQAHQSVEAIESLRNERQQEYLLQQTRAEQAQLDDRTLQQRVRRKRGQICP